jgi:hypothetical protein
MINNKDHTQQNFDHCFGTFFTKEKIISFIDYEKYINIMEEFWIHIVGSINKQMYLGSWKEVVH